MEVAGDDGERIAFNRSFSCNAMRKDVFRARAPSLLLQQPHRRLFLLPGLWEDHWNRLGKVIPDPGKTLKEKPFAPWNTPAYADLYDYLWEACRKHRIPTQTPFRGASP